jgi:hypothetical protein
MNMPASLWQGWAFPTGSVGVSVISLIVDGTNDEISALTGKLGRVSGAMVKSMITKSNQ